MILNVYVNDQKFSINVPQYVIDEGEEFFARMDIDMDKGYQMSRAWVENPDTVKRCQIAADKILTAMHAESDSIGIMMAAYIITRIPGVEGVRMDTQGDMTAHEFVFATES